MKVRVNQENREMVAISSARQVQLWMAQSRSRKTRLLVARDADVDR